MRWKSLFTKRLQRIQRRRALFIVLLAAVGCVLLVASQAATPTAKFEAEDSTATNKLQKVSDSSASGGEYLRFGDGSPDKPAQLSGDWRVVYRDEFSDAAVFASSWERHAPFSANHAGAVSVAGGLLTMKAGAINNYDWTYVSTSGPRSSGEPSYPKMKAWREGYFEARLRYTDSEWAWPAFWLFSAAKSEAWPGENCPAQGGYFNAEWDMMENGVQNGWQHRPAGDWYFTAIHKNTTDHTADGYCGQRDEHKEFSKDMSSYNLADWHTWGGRWIGTQLCTYLDNQLITCDTAYDTMAQPMELHFDIAYLGSCPSWCGPRPTQLEMQVDWVRVWQR